MATSRMHFGAPDGIARGMAGCPIRRARKSRYPRRGRQRYRFPASAIREPASPMRRSTQSMSSDAAPGQLVALAPDFALRESALSPAAVPVARRATRPNGAQEPNLR